MEKALKAILVWRGQRPPRTHLLIVLLDEVGQDIQWDPSAAWLDQVSRWVATSRYPTSLEAFQALDMEIVRAAIVHATSLLAEVKSRIA